MWRRSFSSIKFRKDRVSRPSSLPARQAEAQAPVPVAAPPQQSFSQEPSAMAQIGSMFALGFGMFVGIALVRYAVFGLPKPNS